ncbi:hypothetical protein RvY_07421 [Ramazzottius varieornatus]|uniref:GIY-YIG domain-containing protein n=1 Tax=Ramazzottius varieornatus TaxID=947166 RepID=A0A1D1V232_RAMVA|nr:hypothetical protein RvY_07421 [Ramazzottius varieornatus]
MTARTSRLPVYGCDPISKYERDRSRSLSGRERDTPSQCLYAIIHGDLGTVSKLLEERKVQPNDFIGGVTYMHVAAGAKPKDRATSSRLILEKLLQYGGNPDIRADGQTPIHVACTNDNEPHLRTLIEAGGNVDLTDHRGMSALTLARMYSSNCEAVLEDVIAKREKRTERRNSGGLYPSLVEELSGKLSRQTSASSVASEYHSCVDRSSPPPQVPDISSYAYEKRGTDRSTSRTRSSSRGRTVVFEEPVRHLSPPTPKTAFTRRSTSGSRDVPTTSRPYHDSTSDDEMQKWFASRDNSRTRYSKGKPRHGLEEFDPNNRQKAKEFLDMSLSRLAKSAIATEPKTRQYRRASGKENEVPPAVPEDANYASMTDSGLRRELRRLGENVGPFETSYERAGYIKRLIKLKKEEAEGGIDRSSMAEMAFCRELDQLAEGRYDQAYLDNVESLLSASFQAPDDEKKSFVYLLLDPQISKNLPHLFRSAKNPNMDLFFKLFLRAIFYVGKASKAERPKSHLVDAKRIYRTSQRQRASQKIRRICAIWDGDYGVVLLTTPTLALFKLPSPFMSEQEACTREALLIDVLGFGPNGKLTNEKHGTVYGEMAKWSSSQRRLLASYLLRSAFNDYINGTEKQVFPDQV